MKCLFLSAAVLMLLAMAGAQEPRESHYSTKNAVVDQWKGEIKLQLPQASPAAPAAGLLLPPGTVVETGNGSLELRLEDGSDLLVKPHTRLVLDSPLDSKKDYLSLIIGRIVAKVRKRVGNTPSFRLSTPTAVITVRGTRFAVQVNKRRKTIVDVYEGLVEVAGLGADDRPIIVEPGFSTEVELGQIPELPRETSSPAEPAPPADSGADQSQPPPDSIDQAPPQ